MKKWALVALVFICSCSTFIRDEHMTGLKKYESTRYVMKKDVGKEEAPLRKGEAVNLMILTGGDFVKVYAYAASTDYLKAERVLILFLFDEDFKDKAFDMRYFEERLYQIVDVLKR